MTLRKDTGDIRISTHKNEPLHVHPVAFTPSPTGTFWSAQTLKAPAFVFSRSLLGGWQHWNQPSALFTQVPLSSPLSPPLLTSLFSSPHLTSLFSSLSSSPQLSLLLSSPLSSLFLSPLSSSLLLSSPPSSPPLLSYPHLSFSSIPVCDSLPCLPFSALFVGLHSVGLRSVPPYTYNLHRRGFGDGTRASLAAGSSIGLGWAEEKEVCRQRLILFISTG